MGIGVLYATGAVRQPPFLDSAVLSFDRVGAAAIAICLGLFIEFLLSASHPPAASTSLLVTLGVVQINARGIIAVLSGIALVTVLGEVLRLTRLTSQATEPASD